MVAGPLCVVAPCYNEGEVAVTFVTELGGVLAQQAREVTLWIVDDASTDNTPELLDAFKSPWSNVRVQVLHLPYNVGHQQAIHRGIAEAFKSSAQRFIVMDSDGEDDPAAIDVALRQDASIVLIARGKRSESWTFQLGYFVYRRLFKWLTGRSLSFGNYSVIDRRIAQAVLDQGFVHYAAFLSKQKATTAMIVSDRRPRIDGRSKMSFRSLSIHAFKSLIEYSEEVLALLLKGFFGLAVLSVISITYILHEKLFTDNAIPGWASTLIATLINSTLLCLGFFAIGLMLSQTVALKRHR